MKTLFNGTALVTVALLLSGCATTGGPDNYNENPQLAALIEGSIVFAIEAARSDADTEIGAVKDGLAAANLHLNSFPEFNDLGTYLELITAFGDERVPGVSVSAERWIRIALTLFDEGLLTATDAGQ